MKARLPPPVTADLNCDYVYITLRHLKFIQQVRTKVERDLYELDFHLTRRSYNRVANQKRHTQLEEKLSYAISKQLRLDVDLNQYLEACTDLQSRTVLQQSFEKLPRELRDIVYGFMVGEHQVVVAEKVLREEPSSWNQILGYTVACRSDAFRQHLDFYGFSRLLKPGHVGQETMLEIAETWYSLSKFRFSHPSHAGFALENDLFGFNFDTKALIKDVEVYTYVPMVWGEEVTLLHSLIESIGSLYRLKRRAKIQLSLHFDDQLVTAGADKSAMVPLKHLVLLFPHIQKLLDNEYQVSVKLGYLLKFNVASVGDLTEESWKQKLENHQKAVVARRAARARASAVATGWQ